MLSFHPSLPLSSQWTLLALQEIATPHPLVSPTAVRRKGGATDEKGRQRERKQKSETEKEKKTKQI